LGYLDSGTVTTSFWDTETSSMSDGVGNTDPDPNGVIGKTTAQMKTLSIFTSAGWDFNDVWRMCVDGVSYPRFSWEYSSYGDFGCPDGTDLGDLIIFIDQWLLEELNYDIYQSDNKHIVNFFDWNVFAAGWDGDNMELADFSAEWLKEGAYNADIAPEAGGDGIVNFLDFALFAENWLKGEE
jgi:hypothetical protein